MFDETAAESFYVSRVQAASAAATIAGQPGFLKVDTVGAYMIDEENVAQFVKIAPACLIGITSENVVEQQDALGLYRLTEFTLNVWIVCKGVWAHKDTSDDLHALGRMVKGELAGLVYNVADGNTEGAARTQYISRDTARLDGGLIIGIQQYTIRTLDKP